MVARNGLVLLLLGGLARAQSWPDPEWEKGPPPAGLDLEASDPRLGETRAVVIIHHGKLVAEKYLPGFGPDTPLISWSMAKSITQALVGIAVRKGLVDIDKPMGNPRWAAGDRRNAIPWRQWLNMVDGQDYHEIGVALAGDAGRMLYGPGRLDVAGFAASLPLVHEPGTHWNYNSAGINLIADALGSVLAPGAGPDERRTRMLAFMHDELFGPLGMTSAQPEFDSKGTFVGSALVYATARDFARFGLLYLRGGMWKDRRILPEGWTDFTRAKNPAPNSDIYGAGFWITPASGRGKPYRALTPNGPRDLYCAQGHEGQLIVIVPSKDLVLVRLGKLDDRKGFEPLGDWIVRLVGQF